MMGTASQRTTEATGVVATSMVATPLVGIVSWPLWNWLGGAGATWLTGTEEIRIPARSEAPGLSGGLSVTTPAAAILGGGGNTMIWILGLIAFVALGGPAWALKKIKDRQAADDAWTAAFNAGQAKDAAEFAALKARLDLLERTAFPPKP